MLSGLCNLSVLNEHAATHCADVKIKTPVCGTSLSVFQIPGTRFLSEVHSEIVCFVPKNQVARIGSLAEIILYSKLPSLHGGRLLHPKPEDAPSWYT